MLPAFLTYINEQKLFSEKDTILLAVSGGLDSMVLLNLFAQTQHRFSVAHCNFQLRGPESEKDEKFVQDWCEKHSIQCFSTRFDTKNIAHSQQISIEMAARNLRYEWFGRLRKEYGFDYVATAHHLNDSIETILLNLTKGTGISGIRGILPKNKQIIRPLLFASRENILDYAIKENLAWREDSSNQSNDYQRNLLRNKVIPLLKQINPNLEKTFERNIERLLGLEMDFFAHLNQFRLDAIQENNGRIYIHIQKINDLSAPQYYLEEILKEFGFNFQQAKAITKSLESISGKIFYSEKYRLLKDRDFLIISPIVGSSEASEQEIVLNHLESSQTIPLKQGTLRFEIYRNNGSSPILKQSNPNMALLDLDKIHFPITIRKWQKGDFFIPLGMKGTKKISDYLVDKKISRDEKEQILVFCSGNKIAWLINQRIDERFKLQENSQNILRIWFEA